METKTEDAFLIKYNSPENIGSTHWFRTVSGLALVPPCTSFDFSTKLSGGITPNPCYGIVLKTF